MQKRWYELSPDVCVVISRIELAKENDRTRYARFILWELHNAGYVPNQEIYMKRISSYEMKRWYDGNKTLFMAFEYLKDADKNMQSDVAVNVLRKIREEAVA
ncbi:hypothetical protein IJ541_07715 [bacterium]|nr:hypothetical protein [bacterium]